MHDKSGALLNGFVWKLIDFSSGKGFLFIVQIILAKLLKPEMFGLIGMAIVFTNLLQVVNELGITPALIQKKEVDEVDLSTTFIASLIFSVFSYLLLYLIITPFAINFYENSELYNVILLLGLTLLINPFRVIQKVLLNRELDFKKLAIVEVISNTIAGIGAIILALSGYGVFSIIFLSVGNALVNIPLLWFLVEWRPSIKFSFQRLQEIMSFGLYVTGTNIANYFSKNVDYLIVGKLTNADILGLYTIAFTITDTVRAHLMQLVNSVMYPIYSRMQDDSKSIRKYYLLVIKYNCIIIIPIMSVVICFPDTLLAMLGDEWIEASIVLQLLSISVILHVWGGSSASVFKAIGKPNIEFYLYLTQNLLVTVPLIILMTYYFSLLGTGLAVCIHKAITRIVHFIFLKKYMKLKLNDYIKSLFPGIIYLPVLYLVSEIARLFFDSLGLKIVVLSILFASIIFLFFVYKELYKLYNFLKKRVVNVL